MSKSQIKVEIVNADYEDTIKDLIKKGFVVEGIIQGYATPYWNDDHQLSWTSENPKVILTKR